MSCPDSACEKCETCGESATRLFGSPNLVFKEPRTSSKWEDFSYRAGYLKDGAQEERRNAEAAWKLKHGDDAPLPYQNIDDTGIQGVFREGGVDNELPPDLTSSLG